MADKRIIELDATSELDSFDFLPIDNSKLASEENSGTRKIRVSTLLETTVKVMLTQAEYDALPSDKLTDGKVYYITDESKIIINGTVYGAGGGGGGTTVVANPQGSATANLNKLQVGSTIYSVGGLEIIDTLEAGETELTISNNAITTTATYDFFTDAFGVSPTDVEVTAGQIVLTFEEQQSDVSVKVRIS